MSFKKQKIKKKQNNSIKSVTFGKLKVKVGKFLKKDNHTDTSIQTKAIVLLEQLKTNNDNVKVSYRGLSLNDLCRRMGHYSEPIIRQAIIDMKELLSKERDLLVKNLRMIIPCIGRLITAGLKNSSTQDQLKSLIRIVFEVPSDVLSSHFNLLITYILTALTDINFTTKCFAFTVLLILIKNQGELCVLKPEIFDRYLELMSSDTRPKNKTLLLESGKIFLSVFEKQTQKSLWKSQDKISLNMEKKKCNPSIQPIIPQRNAIYFPIIYNKPLNFNDNLDKFQKLKKILEELK